VKQRGAGQQHRKETEIDRVAERDRAVSGYPTLCEACSCRRDTSRVTTLIKPCQFDLCFPASSSARAPDEKWD
jgi:hypothetical protein